MSQPDDAGTSDLQGLVSESSRQFLDGHLTPEEKRHAFNIGRVCLEFACLEAAIGDLAAGLAQARSGATAYMDFVKTGTAAKNAIGDISAADQQWSNLLADYQRFKTERDRFAHASVGAMVEEKEDDDGRRVSPSRPAYRSIREETSTGLVRFQFSRAMKKPTTSFGRCERFECSYSWPGQNSPSSVSSRPLSPI